ncbi:MAG: glycosyltransferase family 2 protein [Planctomycetes bacterium]|nr:glycosyltransferase family 2 protein [Planctomycetota bacterium]
MDTTSLSRTAVLIPALNEADNMPVLLPRLVELGVGAIIVCDNGSTDDTARLASAHGATMVAHEPTPGYGAACYAGIEALALVPNSDRIDVVAFLDADLADDQDRLPQLVEPILQGDADIVIGVRTRGQRELGSMSLPQVFGNALATGLIRLGWGHRYQDLGPFRAIRRTDLTKMQMKDRAFGWTVEMQIKAVEQKLQILEVDMPYFKRRGKSKISGTVRGVFLAGYWILGTCARLWWTKKRRIKANRSDP